MSSNLGNVSGLVISANPPVEADGTTEKRYVVWAKPINNGNAYELRIWRPSVSAWRLLDPQSVIDDSDTDSLLTTLSAAKIMQLIGSEAYSLTLTNNVMKLMRGTQEMSSHDLSLYIDDTNLARILSGVLSNGILTVTRDDNSTFEIDLTPLIDNWIVVATCDAENAANGSNIVRQQAAQISAFDQHLTFEYIAGQTTSVLKFSDHFKQNFLRVQDADDNAVFFNLGIFEALKVRGATFDAANKTIIFTGTGGSTAVFSKYTINADQTTSLSETGTDYVSVGGSAYDAVQDNTLSDYDGEMLTIKQRAYYAKVEMHLFCDGDSDFQGSLTLLDSDGHRVKTSNLGTYGKNSSGIKLEAIIPPDTDNDLDFNIQYSQSAYGQKILAGSYIKVTKL